MKISLSEVSFSPLSIVDIGKVFWWSGRLFRGILIEHVADVKNLFDCGLISVLVGKGFFVKSWITSIELEGYGLVIEHEVIDVPVYPKEWTFSMLKDAAMLVLSINEVILKFGYQTKDCHGYNVLFSNSRPIYIDLGSFCKPRTANNTLFAYSEFMRSYYYPLKIWRSGSEYWGLRSAASVGSLISAADYLKYRWPIFRYMKNSFLNKTMRIINALIIIQHLDPNKLMKYLPHWLIPILMQLGGLIGYASISKLKVKVGKIKIPAEVTIWSNYHNEFNQQGSPNTTPRFDFVINKITSLKVSSVLELAGNQGSLARLLAEKCQLKTVICTDADSYALDKGYRLAKRDNAKINWAILNPFDFENNYHEIDLEKRFCSEAVIALAVTHHLILTQGYPVDYILDTFARFTKKYLLIEFMPLGLYNGVAAPPVPTWYNEEWFKAEFTKKFELIDQVQLEENRIIFVGKKLC